MSAVEIRLDPSLLSREMGAMRVWLDEHRFEPSSFSCRDDDDALLVSLEFQFADQARAFAERFGGRASFAPRARDPQGNTTSIGLSRSGIIG